MAVAMEANGAACAHGSGAAAIVSGVLLWILLSPAQAQTFNVIHDFSGGGDGARPFAGLIMDRAGSLYGTASFGGSGPCFSGCGNVFRLKRAGSSWVLSVLYRFQGGPNDGAEPLAGVTIAADGRLYGTTGGGGNPACNNGCGTVFQLRPPVRACASIQCPWTETVLYRFNGNDGGNPAYGSLVFDQSGSLYGTTQNGGAHGYGVVYKLTPSGGGWTESSIYDFTGGNDGAFPASGLMVDQTGELYGTTLYGGTLNRGVVYKLTPSGPGWVQSVLSNFENGGQNPIGGLILDANGNLFGTTYLGGAFGSGTVFQLQPTNDGWTQITLHDFTGDGGPAGALAMDPSGNLSGGSETTGGRGALFRLTPSNGGWNYSELHDFNGSDGQFPFGNVIVDTNGNVFGTCSIGGGTGNGVVWEITP